MLNAALIFNWIKVTPEPNFEFMSFNPFSSNNNFSDCNQDVNFFLDNIPSFNTEYLPPSDVKIGLNLPTHSQCYTKSSRKNSEDFKELYKTLNLKFSIVHFSETWADDNKLEGYF